MDNPNLESEILHKVSGICSLLNLSGVHSITDIQKYQLLFANPSGTHSTRQFFSELFPPSISQHFRCTDQKSARLGTYKACSNISTPTTLVLNVFYIFF